MSYHSSNRAILILESPWELDPYDSNRCSVIPFVEGIGKFAGDTEIYHANFYDKSSFEKALNCLCKRKFKNTIVYIAAHGFKKKIGNLSITDLMRMVGEKSKGYNITGLMLGSCFVGGNVFTMEAYLEQTQIRWAAGYSSTSKWLEGTLIDCSILSAMSDLDDEDYSERDTIIDGLGSAISGFSPNFYIGDDYNDEPVKLRDSLQFVIQPRGQGNRAKTVTPAVFQVHNDKQLK